MRKRILIVDDDPAFAAPVRDYLRNSGNFSVEMAESGAAMWRYLETNKADLIILDVSLPDESGMDLIRMLRLRDGGQPVIMMSSTYVADSDKVSGLEWGANIYFVKPVPLRLLLAQINTLLQHQQTQDNPQEKYHFGPYEFNTRQHRLMCGNVEIPLTDAERGLLVAFMNHPNQVLTREKLITLLAHENTDPESRTIDVRVSRLRRRLELDPETPVFIRTVRQQGYRFTPDGLNEPVVKSASRHG